MPPASRGFSVGSDARLPYRKYRSFASIPRPSSARVPHSAKARIRAEPTRSETSKPRPGSEPSERARSSNVFYRLASPYFPRFVRERPGLQRGISSFLFWAPVGGFVIYHFPIEPLRVTGPSMAPTINAQCTSDRDESYSPAWILVRKYGLDTFKGLQVKLNQGEHAVGRYARGDLVVYSTPHDPEKWAVKRVVAIPGDKIMPLKGYAESEEAVVVPYNHLWVEGDANDRKKSMDSNYFGPLSQSLVKGRVMAILSPAWDIFSWRSANQPNETWPARQQGRVEEEAVEEATADPDHLRAFQRLEGESGRLALRMLREQGSRVEERFHSDELFQAELKQTWIYGKMAARGHPDPEMKQQAKEIVEALEDLVGKDGLVSVSLGKTNKKRRRRGESTIDPAKAQDIDAEIERSFASGTRA